MTDRLLLALVLTMSLGTGSGLHAQLSPGELINGHAQLEGLGNCTECHDVGHRISGTKCLACHQEIRSRIDRGKGFHASQKVRSRECIACHFDHKGRDFEMIRWQNGKDRFEHELTGYKLEGKHRTRCENCHQERHITDPAVRSQQGKSLSLAKTLLGLSQTCTSCHFDEHRGQLEHECISCHDFDSWRQSAATLFNHDRTSFKLIGLHRTVPCTRCHFEVRDPQSTPSGSIDDGFIRYKPLEFGNCTTCHKDVHENRFGQNCRRCHSERGWKIISASSFDHTTTRYPLLGRHLLVACSSCHQPDLQQPSVYRGLKFERCTDCHADEHEGQLTSRPDSGTCESCHGVSGFVPSTFTVERHNLESKYVLLGQHAKTLCGRCHPKTESAVFQRRSGFPAPSDSTIILRFKDQHCSNCHIDIHGGQFINARPSKECEACHQPTTWKNLLYDHNKDSRFKLTGKHQSLECSKCHTTVNDGLSVRQVRYKPMDASCEDCHKDVHDGQFIMASRPADGRPGTACDRCHTTIAWKPGIFDHGSARFVLTGAHEKVACEKCHPSTMLKSETPKILYRPISYECASCHPDIHEGVLDR